VAKELPALQKLPSTDYEVAGFKTVSIYDDSYVRFESSHYSAPHQYRGEKVELKITDYKIEIYRQGERIALHRRNRHASGDYVTDPSHLPENARAYHEATPQNILSQARFLSSELAGLIDEMFNENTCGHLRRAQGLVRVARIEIEKSGAERARSNISRAIKDMQRFKRIRVPYFEELLLNLRREVIKNSLDKTKIDRRPNPNLRHVSRDLKLVINNPN
jgi:hypothetical protein